MKRYFPAFCSFFLFGMIKVFSQSSWFNLWRSANSSFKRLTSLTLILDLWPSIKSHCIYTNSTGRYSTVYENIDGRNTAARGDRVKGSFVHTHTLTYSRWTFTAQHFSSVFLLYPHCDSRAPTKTWSMTASGGSNRTQK